MNCPKCNAPLTDKDVETISFSKCPACGGVWFSNAAFDKVLDSPPKELLESDETNEELDQKAANCPNCGGSMIKLKSLENKTVTLDSCLVCYGKWLDAGELAKIANKGVMSKIKKFLSKHFSFSF